MMAAISLVAGGGGMVSFEVYSAVLVRMRKVTGF
jgi:hypothetical protein